MIIGICPPWSSIMANWFGSMPYSEEVAMMYSISSPWSTVTSSASATSSRMTSLANASRVFCSSSARCSAVSWSSPAVWPPAEKCCSTCSAMTPSGTGTSTSLASSSRTLSRASTPWRFTASSAACFFRSSLSSAMVSNSEAS